MRWLHWMAIVALQCSLWACAAHVHADELHTQPSIATSQMADDAATSVDPLCQAHASHVFVAVKRWLNGAVVEGDIPALRPASPGLRVFAQLKPPPRSSL